MKYLQEASEKIKSHLTGFRIAYEKRMREENALKKIELQQLKLFNSAKHS